MNTDTDFEARWPELFEPLTQQQREQVIGACWYVLDDGFPATRETVERITTLLVDDPQKFAVLYAPYTEARSAPKMAGYDPQDPSEKGATNHE